MSVAYFIVLDNDEPGFELQSLWAKPCWAGTEERSGEA